MAMTPGLSPNLRLSQPPANEEEGDGVTIDTTPDDETIKANKILEIEHDDGTITISMDGKPLEEDLDAPPPGWFDNLVSKIDHAELTRISDDLMRGIADDLESRKEWIEARATGIKLLGLTIEIPNTSGAIDGAPVEGMSRVRHPLLLEAVLRFQANARAELLPTDGPVKIRNDDNNAELREDMMANALQRDLNHYLTSTASEYYPDTDRMLLMLGFGGTAFKKVYFCPLRNRPVSETVDADDLIVNNATTDLKNAKRITHRSFMRASTVKRLQIMGVYEDIDLGTAKSPDLDSMQRAKKDQQGISPDPMNPDDRDREIYETYCELDILGFEHKFKGKVTGLEIPYRVTIDVSTTEILSIVRNYNEPEKDLLPEARTNIVKYTYVPGFGFYDIGLLHILGNTTNAITAAWREMLDAGMFASFPGFLLADTGARQNTNIFRVPPGGGALVKTGGMPINQAIMALPYKDPGAGLMTLTQNIAETGARIGNTSELQVGEGRADIPVGTTLAMIEQAQKVLNSVHKRMHTAQAEEFKMLCDVFKEHPKSFWEKNKKPSAQWNEQMLLEALKNNDLVPQADPNTASQTQRLMKIMALKQLQSANAALYDPIAIDTACLQAMGWSNPMQFMAPASAQGQPPPEMLQMQSKMKTQEKLADAKVMEIQQRGKTDEGKLQLEAQRVQAENQRDSARVDMEKSQTIMKGHMEDARIQTERAEMAMKMKTEKEKEERDSMNNAFKERMQLVDAAQNLTVHPESAGLVAPLLKPALDDIHHAGGLKPKLHHE